MHKQIAVGAGAALVAIVALVLVAKKLKLSGDSFNPLSDQNLAYRAANGIYGAVTGNNTDTVGTATYNYWHDESWLTQNRFEQVQFPSLYAQLDTESAYFLAAAGSGEAEPVRLAVNEGGAVTGRTINP